MKSYRRVLASICLGILTCLGTEFSRAEAVIAPEKELLIRDLSVVEDGRAKGVGPWSFGGLLQEMAPSSVSPGEFVRDWIEQWEKITSLNGFPVEPRRFARYAGLWPRAARAKLEPESAPFRLLAIVYRPDIQNDEAPDGEFRLVYCGVRPDDRAGIPFQVIFEFRLPSDPVEWAHRFHALTALEFGPDFNSALESITRLLATRENFLRVRTHDFIGAPLWEMRQFELDSSGLLAQVPLTDTPDLEFAENPARVGELFELLRKRASEILAGTFRFPKSFLAGAGPVKHDSFRWLPETRRNLPSGVGETISLGTCSGCHSGETRTIFSHLGPRGEKFVSPISPYLRGELANRSARLAELIAPGRGLAQDPRLKRKVH